MIDDERVRYQIIEALNNLDFKQNVDIVFLELMRSAYNMFLKQCGLVDDDCVTIRAGDLMLLVVKSMLEEVQGDSYGR